MSRNLKLPDFMKRSRETRARVLCFFSSLNSLTETDTKTAEEFCKTSNLRWYNSQENKKHLALGNLVKLVFWSILSFENWSFEKILILVRENLRGNKKHKNWAIENKTILYNFEDRLVRCSFKLPPKRRRLMIIAQYWL